MLSSDEGALIRVDPALAAAQGAAYEPERLWQEPSRTFMKGLTGEPDPPPSAAAAPSR